MSGTDDVRAAEPAIREAVTPGDIALARALFREYATWLAVDLCFQGFADELASLPGAYARPLGRLYVVGPPGQAFGCIALRPLPTPSVGEIKRLFVRADARKGGWGRQLAETIIAGRRIPARRDQNGRDGDVGHVHFLVKRRKCTEQLMHGS